MTSLNSLEKKIYQLLINRLDGNNIKSKEYQEKILGLVKKGIGGFIIFGGEKNRTKDFINKIQSAAEIPLFIASDIERGVGQQIKGTTTFPCPMALASAIDKKRPEHNLILENALKAISNEAIDIGINMPLIPVLDVNKNPDNPIICTRAFSDSAEDVSWFGSEYIRILEDFGLISSGKHFPGHGDTSVDSHISLPVINKAKNELMNADLIPFIHAIKTGVSSIMIGHLTIPALDLKPASLSKKIITDLLKNELGFRGLILTDALNMNALNDFGNVPAECMAAGVDILLHTVDADLTVKELIYAIKSKILDESIIDKAFDRILNAKSKLKNIKHTTVDYKKNKALSRQITDMSITLLQSKSGILPLNDLSKVQVLFAGDSELYKSSPLKDYFKSDPNSGLIIVAVFTSISAWKGSSGISNDEKNSIIGLIKKAKHSIVISFGSPYVLCYFPEADALIAAYESTEQAQIAAIKCLRGEIDFKGKLPVSITLGSI